MKQLKAVCAALVLGSVVSCSALRGLDQMTGSFELTNLSSEFLTILVNGNEEFRIQPNAIKVLKTKVYIADQQYVSYGSPSPGPMYVEIRVITSSGITTARMCWAGPGTMTRITYDPSANPKFECTN